MEQEEEERPHCPDVMMRGRREMPPIQFTNAVPVTITGDFRYTV